MFASNKITIEGGNGDDKITLSLTQITLPTTPTLDKINTFKINGGNGKDTISLNSQDNLGIQEVSLVYKNAITTHDTIIGKSLTNNMINFNFSTRNFLGDSTPTQTPDGILDNPGSFISGTTNITAAATNEHWIWDNTNKILYYDVDGSGPITGTDQAKQTVAKFTNSPDLVLTSNDITFFTVEFGFLTIQKFDTPRDEQITITQDIDIEDLELRFDRHYFNGDKNYDGILDNNNFITGTINAATNPNDFWIWSNTDKILFYDEDGSLAIDPKQIISFETTDGLPNSNISLNENKILFSNTRNTIQVNQQYENTTEIKTTNTIIGEAVSISLNFLQFNTGDTANFKFKGDADEDGIIDTSAFISRNGSQATMMNQHWIWNTNAKKLFYDADGMPGGEKEVISFKTADGADGKANSGINLTPNNIHFFNNDTTITLTNPTPPQFIAIKNDTLSDININVKQPAFNGEDKNNDGLLDADNFFTVDALTPQDANDFWVWNNNTKFLYYDADGVGGNDAIAVLFFASSSGFSPNPTANLTAANITLFTAISEVFNSISDNLGRAINNNTPLIINLEFNRAAFNGLSDNDGLLSTDNLVTLPSTIATTVVAAQQAGDVNDFWIWDARPLQKILYYDADAAGGNDAIPAISFKTTLGNSPNSNITLNASNISFF